MPMTKRRDALLQHATSLCEGFATCKPLNELLKHFSEDIVCFEHGLPALAPFLGREFQGLQGARDYFELIGDLLDFQNMKFSDYLIDTDAGQVSVRGEASFIWKSNQNTWDEVFLYRLHFNDDDKICRYEVWADSGAAYLASRGELTSIQQGRCKTRKVVLVTYEFTYSAFSGNGILARSIVKSLLYWGCQVTVWCCRPAQESTQNHLIPPEISTEAKLTTISLALPEQYGWRKLDDESGWEYYQFDNLEASQQEALSKAVAEADAICAVDWTGGYAVRSLPAVKTLARPPLVYMNFRVYSSGMTDIDRRRAWFNNMERQALHEVSAIIALSERDRTSLSEIAGKAISPAPYVNILLPPLRGDMQELASREEKPEDAEHLPTQLAAIITGDNKDKRFVTCVARLSPEKNVMRFVRFVEQAATVLKELNLIPLLAGSSADVSYADSIKKELRQVAPHAIIVDTFLSPQGMVAIFKRTALNFHPCAYDAYGMTIVEAAACGVPSVLASGLTVGASALILDDASLPVSMPPADANEFSSEAVHEIVELLRDKNRLQRLSEKATERALAWDEIAYGAKLLEIINRVSL